jgi:hypothetical protein
MEYGKTSRAIAISDSGSKGKQWGMVSSPGAMEINMRENGICS